MLHSKRCPYGFPFGFGKDKQHSLNGRNFRVKIAKFIFEGCMC